MMLTSAVETLLVARLPGAGPATYWQLFDHYPNLKTALAAPLTELARWLPEESLLALRDYRGDGERSALGRQVAADLAYAAEHGIQLLTAESDAYPPLLREIKRPPPLLYVAGDAAVLHLPQIAVVGSRSPTPGGRQSAFEFSRSLASQGVVITSGLALGIDGAAHRGALAGSGRTVAVLGTGLDRLYPRRHADLAAEIVADGGALVSEFPFATAAHAGNFPRRNRIISGLSLGTLVVEAALKSGSLITARYALEQNREVFAIPGNINNPLSRGCHSLLRDGAKLVETAADIFEELQGYFAFEPPAVARPLPAADQLLDAGSEPVILAQLGYDCLSFDDLAARTQLPAGELMAALVTLELKGLIASGGKGYQALAPA